MNNKPSYPFQVDLSSFSVLLFTMNFAVIFASNLLIFVHPLMTEKLSNRSEKNNK